MSDTGLSLRAKTYEARCASRGVATGTARIVEINREETPSEPPQIDIAGMKEITAGDIVVVPAGLPELTDRLQMAGGLILYTETMRTARGPVFARQKEIPAVIDCPIVATELDAGEQVTVDASEGEVIRYDASTCR